LDGELQCIESSQLDGEDGLVDLISIPGADMSAAMEENLA
jgi:hypothetical protein